jgi:hypothetical protein
VHARPTRPKTLAVTHLMANQAVKCDARQERPRAPHDEHQNQEAAWIAWVIADRGREELTCMRTWIVGRFLAPLPR